MVQKWQEWKQWELWQQQFQQWQQQVYCFNKIDFEIIYAKSLCKIND